VTRTPSSQTAATPTGSAQTHSMQRGQGRATRTQLPRTASQLPLLAMAGAVSLVSGVSLRYWRTRQR
jgi:hypothetical protein